MSLSKLRMIRAGALRFTSQTAMTMVANAAPAAAAAAAAAADDDDDDDDDEDDKRQATL